MRGRLRKRGIAALTDRPCTRRIEPRLAVACAASEFRERPWRSKIAAVAAAVVLVVAAVHSIGKAGAYELHDLVGPVPPPGTEPVPPPPGHKPLPPIPSPPGLKPAPAAAAAPWSFALPFNLRFEGGIGYNSGGADTTASVHGLGSLTTSLGNGGIAAEAALWADGLLLPNISLGAQYLHFDNSGSLSVRSAADSLLGPFSASASLGLATNAMMFDAAWRPQIQRFHPFLGTGIGVAFTDLSGSALGFSASDSETALAGQAFLGFDYDVTPSVYVGVTGRFFYSEATYHATSLVTPTGGSVPVVVSNSIDITDRPLSLMAHIGVQF